MILVAFLAFFPAVTPTVLGNGSFNCVSQGHSDLSASRFGATKDCFGIAEECFVKNSSAVSAVLYEARTGNIIYGKNADAKLPNASTTKIITALTVLRNADVNEIITVPKEAVGVEGSSIYLKENERISVYDLLTGLMLQSGNDSAVALALYVGKTLENFASMMNATARECGAADSNFVTPHGLHDDKHYTTATDLALISAKAMENEVFAEIVAKKSAKIGTGENVRVIVNKNKLLKMLPEAVGIKTGYTKKAGRCLVASAKKNDALFIAVVLNCGPMFEECRDALKFAMENYSVREIIRKNQVMGSIRAKNGNEVVISKESFCVLEKAGQKKEYEIKLIPCDFPCKDDVAGYVQVSSEGKVLYKGKLYSLK